MNDLFAFLCLLISNFMKFQCYSNKKCAECPSKNHKTKKIWKREKKTNGIPINGIRRFAYHHKKVIKKRMDCGRTLIFGLNYNDAFSISSNHDWLRSFPIIMYVINLILKYVLFLVLFNLQFATLAICLSFLNGMKNESYV